MAGYRKLGLPTDQRRAMLRSLVTSFLKHGKIETTETRAKETRSIAEKMITLAKRGDLHARRQVLAFVNEEEVVKTYLTTQPQSTLKETVDTLECTKLVLEDENGA